MFEVSSYMELCGRPPGQQWAVRLEAQLACPESLDIEQTSIGDAGLESLARLPLRYLHLNATGVTDSGMAFLRNHATLKELRLLRAKITWRV